MRHYPNLLSRSSVFRNLYQRVRAPELGVRSLFLHGWGSLSVDGDVAHSGTAKALGVAQARISEIKRGKISQFSLDLLVRLAAHAGLDPKLELVA